VRDTPGMGDDHVAADEATEQRVQCSRDLRALFATYGLDASPYTRLRVAVGLTMIAGRGPLEAPERHAARRLVDVIGCSRNQAQGGLRTLRKAGCLLDSENNILLAYDGRIAGTVSDDPLVLDELCVRAMTRLADEEFDGVFEPGPLREAFTQLAGRPPVTTADATRAVSDVQAVASRKPRQGSVLAAVSGIVRGNGFDPVPKRRAAILRGLSDIVEHLPGDLTAEQLAVELEGNPATVGATTVMAILTRGRALLDADGRPADQDVPVSALGADEAGLEEICRQVLSDLVSNIRPGLLDTYEGARALTKVLTEEPPLTTTAAIRILEHRDLHPEPNARSSVLREIFNLLDGQAEWTMPDLLDAVVVRSPVLRSQARNVIYALTRADLLTTTQTGPQRRVRLLMRASVDDLNEALVEFFLEQIALERPEIAEDDSVHARITVGLGGRHPSLKADEPTLGVPREAQIRSQLRAMRAVIAPRERAALLQVIDSATISAPEAGVMMEEIASRAVADGVASRTATRRMLNRLVRLGLFTDIEGATVTRALGDIRVGRLEPSVADVERRLVESYVDQVLDEVEGATAQDIRLILSSG
jgi:hypothetical protein